jgi:hypothetical protein
MTLRELIETRHIWLADAGFWLSDGYTKIRTGNLLELTIWQAGFVVLILYIILVRPFIGDNGSRRRGPR